jgi:hypothetical protein
MFKIAAQCLSPYTGIKVHLVYCSRIIFLLIGCAVLQMEAMEMVIEYHDQTLIQ